MSKKHIVTFTGDCPYTESYQTIAITFLEIHTIGSMAPGYKKDSYSCPLIDECSYPAQDRYHRCPVYLSAPNEPY